MAAGRLPAPGTEYGPCVSVCEHRDCGATREMAAAICGVCDQTIGYEQPFYRIDVEAGEASAVKIRDRGATVLADMAGRLHELRHARCLEEEALS